ncbi:hypothetical protein FRC10_001158 [Ceratobasidium sp. 414]|nr:hypothetical protein FRC10_001158 [Ceratobasidium sp. 414]
MDRCALDPSTQTASTYDPFATAIHIVSQARSQAQSSRPLVPPLPTNLPNINNLCTLSSPDIDDALPFGLGSLCLSLDLDDVGNNTDDAIAEDEERLLDPDASQPSTPIMLKETDIGLNESSTIQITQAWCRASWFLNARRLVPHRAASSPRRIPTVPELKMNARRLYKLHHHKHHRRHHAPAPETSRCCKRGMLCAGALTPEQQMVMGPTEYHLFKDIICENPWPEDQEVFLQAAENYVTNITGISGADVFTESFLDTIFDKMSANRGNLLTRIEVMVEQEFTVTIVNKPEIYQLLKNDQFLYPNVNRYFCVGALGAALEIILFKSVKTVRLAFMEEFCQPDDAEKCAHRHWKLCDQTARKGVSPGAIAFATTQLTMLLDQMYWALEKMYLGTNIHFNKGHFHGTWHQYFRTLVKLPHLGQLRIDLLDQLKEHYMDHWPAEEQDDDEDSFPAW